MDEWQKDQVMICITFLQVNKFCSIEFNVIDAEKNNCNAVVAVSNQKDFPSSVEINVNDTAALYLFIAYFRQAAI